MFWSDWGEIPKIECAGMDGSHESRVVIVSYNIAWPNGLTIDLVETRLYWSDAKLGYIHSCDYFGESRTVVTDTGIHHPFSLTLYNEVLYWTDWETSSVQFYNTTSGDRGVAERFNGARVNGIRAFMESRQPTGTL